MLYLIYPYLDREGSYLAPGYGWAHPYEVNRWDPHLVFDLPPYLVIEEKSLALLKGMKGSGGTKRTKIKNRVFRGIVGEKRKDGRYPMTLKPVSPGEAQAMAMDIEKIYPVKNRKKDENKDWWGFWSKQEPIAPPKPDPTGRDPEPPRDRDSDRDRDLRDKDRDSDRDRDLRDKDRDSDRYRDRDRDRDTKKEEKVLTWGWLGRFSRYSFREAFKALKDYSYQGSRFVPEVIAKAHELISAWLSGEFRVRDIELAKAFCRAVLENEIYTSLLTKELFFGAILEGRLRDVGNDPDLVQEAAIGLLTLGVPLRPHLAALLSDYFHSRWSSSIPPRPPDVQTSFPPTLHRTDVRPIFQPLTQEFLREEFGRLGQKRYDSFVNSQTFDVVASLLSTHQCQISQTILHYIKDLFGLKSTVFVPFPLHIILIRNHFIFRDKREMAELGAESLIDYFLKDPKVNLIVIPLSLKQAEGPSHYRVLHKILSSLFLPGVPAFGDFKASGHANTVVLDKRSRTFKLFEPHTRSERGSLKTKDDEEKEKHFEFVEGWARSLGFSPEDYICVTTPGSRVLQGYDFLCTSWSLFYSCLQMINPDHSEASLRQAMSYSTLTWFLFFIYMTMPNLIANCEPTLCVDPQNPSLVVKIKWVHGQPLAYNLPIRPWPSSSTGAGRKGFILQEEVKRLTSFDQAFPLMTLPSPPPPPVPLHDSSPSSFPSHGDQSKSAPAKE